MSLTLKECTERGYYYSALVYGSARNKWKIVSQLRNNVQVILDTLDKDSQEFEDTQVVKNRWADVSTRLNWLWKFTSTGFGTGESVKHLLEQIYVLLGEDVNDLVDFDSYDYLPILSPMSFTEEPPQEIKDLESVFEAEDSIFRDDSSLETQYFTIFNYLLLDVYRFMAMGCWLDSQLDRTNIIGDDFDLALDIWDIIIESSKNFLYQSRTCFATTEIETMKYFKNQDPADIRFMHTTKKKFLDSKEHLLAAVGGLYKINYDKLPEEWKSKVEVLPDTLVLS